MAKITYIQGKCGHKWEGDIEPGHNSIDDKTLSLRKYQMPHSLLAIFWNHENGYIFFHDMTKIPWLK